MLFYNEVKLKLKTGEIAVIYDFLFVICAGWNGKIIVK
jgi:hypothetical protein